MGSVARDGNFKICLLTLSSVSIYYGYLFATPRIKEMVIYITENKKGARNDSTFRRKDTMVMMRRS